MLDASEALPERSRRNGAAGKKLCHHDYLNERRLVSCPEAIDLVVDRSVGHSGESVLEIGSFFGLMLRFRKERESTLHASGVQRDAN